MELLCQPLPRTGKSAKTCRSALHRGKSFDASLALKAPKVPGTYLLLLDVVTPDLGSLVASGANPTLVRVTVVAAAAR